MGAAALVAAALLAAPRAWGETRVSINGADQQPLTELITGTTHAEWLADATNIGANWPGIPTPTNGDYPASLISPSADTSLNIGQAALNTSILNAVSSGQPVVVTGLSMGTIVIDREITYLDTDPSAPSPSKLTFIEFATPSAPGSFGGHLHPRRGHRAADQLHAGAAARGQPVQHRHRERAVGRLGQRPRPALGSGRRRQRGPRRAAGARHG